MHSGPQVLQYRKTVLVEGMLHTHYHEWEYQADKTKALGTGQLVFACLRCDDTFTIKGDSTV